MKDSYKKFNQAYVMITGAGGGIGRCLAARYAEEGAHVIIIDRDQQRLSETKKLLQQQGVAQQVYDYVVDLAKPEQIEHMISQLLNHQLTVDILVNNAGFGIWKHPFDLELAEWDDVINTNLRGTFLLSREIAKLMKSNKRGGAIINISSTRALMSEPNSEAYAASKGGILSLTHAMAVSLGQYQITVNAICPGWIETGDYEALRTEDHTQHPAQRVGKPEDIVRACFYLSDPANDFVTGTQLIVDGGMTRQMIYEE